MLRVITRVLGGGLLGVVVALACSKKESGESAGVGAGGAAGSGASVSGTGGKGSGPMIGFSGSANVGNAGASGNGGVGVGECGGVISKASPRAANLLLVMDLSGSMNTKFGTTDASRWQAVTAALGSALTGVQNRAAFGLDLYPSNGECTLPASGDLAVAVAPGASSVGAIKLALAMATPAGGTPTAGALTRALQYFTTGAGMALPGDKFVVLATDGGPNCNAQAAQCTMDQCTATHDRPADCSAINCCEGEGGKIGCLDEAGTTAAVAALAAAGIKTVVVGLPGVAPYSATLNAFATAGGFAQAGSEKYFAVDEMLGVAGLTSTFETITTELIKSCRLKLATTPPDTSKVNVIVDGVFVPKEGPNGWDFDPPGAPGPEWILLKGATCLALEQNGAENVTVQYGCPPPVIR